MVRCGTQKAMGHHDRIIHFIMHVYTLNPPPPPTLSFSLRLYPVTRIYTMNLLITAQTIGHNTVYRLHSDPISICVPMHFYVEKVGPGATDLKMLRVDAKSWISCRTTLMPLSSDAFRSSTMFYNAV